jgi:ribonuclease VapC
MSFVDASAIVAILNSEPGYEELEKRLAETDGTLHVSPLVRFESTLGIARAIAGGPHASKPDTAALAAARELVSAFLDTIKAEEMAVSADIGMLALDAAGRYGKFVGHPADLNFGDCFAYACAKHRGIGLIYKGEDFAKTDLA